MQPTLKTWPRDGPPPAFRASHWPAAGVTRSSPGLRLPGGGAGRGRLRAPRARVPALQQAARRARGPGSGPGTLRAPRPAGAGRGPAAGPGAEGGRRGPARPAAPCLASPSSPAGREGCAVPPSSPAPCPCPEAESLGAGGCLPSPAAMTVPGLQLSSLDHDLPLLPRS